MARGKNTVTCPHCKNTTPLTNILYVSGTSEGVFLKIRAECCHEYLIVQTRDKNMRKVNNKVVTKVA